MHPGIIRVSMRITCVLVLAVHASFSPGVFAEYLHAKDNTFKYAFSSGVFSIHTEAHSVDWNLVNTGKTPQRYRVTVYEVAGKDRKIIVPGPLSGNLSPAGKTHNANNIGNGKPFENDRRYEIVVESDSAAIKPQVEMWRAAGSNSVINETVIPARKFRLLRK